MSRDKQPPFGVVIEGHMGAAAAGEVLTTRDPATGKVLAEVACGDADDVDRAVRTAARAAENESWRRAPAERGHVLHRMAEVIDDARDELARLESLDTGKPLRDALVDVDAAVRCFEYFASASEHDAAETLPLGPGAHAWTTWQPYGVVGHIVHLEACHLHADVLVGNGSIVLHEVEVEPWSIIAANSVVLNGTHVPSGAIAVGSPAVVKEGRARRELITEGVEAYLARAERFRRELRRLD